MPHPPGPGDAPPLLAEIGGTSVAMQDVVATIRLVAAATAPVLLLGESGTGAALVARAIHDLSTKRPAPFIRIACGALADDELDRELCGAAAGAGTIFLDDVTALSPRLQAKLLGMLEDRQRLHAGAETVAGDARLIAASDRDLFDEVARERLRADLAHRLGAVPIVLPPLRSRREDIPALVAHFLDRANLANGRRVLRVAPAAAEALARHHWPGNVGELEAVVERCVVLAPGDEITPDLLPPAIRGGRAPAAAQPGRGGDLDTLARELVEQGLATAAPDDDTLFDRIVSRVERELVAQMLAACGGVQLKAAARLGINRNTLRKKLLEHGLEAEEST